MHMFIYNLGGVGCIISKKSSTSIHSYRTLLMTTSAHVKLGGQGKGAMSTLMTVIQHLV